MKVLFSNPPWWDGSFQYKNAAGQDTTGYIAGVRAGSRWPFTMQIANPPDQYGFGSYLPYPFFMGYAATYAQKMTGAQMVFRDSIALRESYERYFAFLMQEQFNFIVIESATPSWSHDKVIIQQIERFSPKTKVIITGPIASIGKAIFDEVPIHAGVCGEYEKGVAKVLNGATGLIDHDLLTVDEMNASPFPYFDDVIAHRYIDMNPRGVQTPQAHVWSSRGCPYKCIFCVWPATMTGNDPTGTGKRTVRHYSGDYMEAFLTELVQKYGYRSIYFDDDTFNLGDKHVEKMCAIMRKLNVPWSAMCRADTSRMELWKEMKDSGCFGVKLGFESGNQQVVDNIVNKHLDLEYARKAVAECKRVGLTVHGTFTYGLPGETHEQMLETRRYRDSLGLDTFQESGTAEIEGTPLHTLSREKALKKYSGAQINEEYVRETDGRVKFDKLRASLEEV